MNVSFITANTDPNEENQGGDLAGSLHVHRAQSFNEVGFLNTQPITCSLERALTASLALSFLNFLY